METDIAKLGIDVDSTKVKEANAALDKLNATGKKVPGTTDNVDKLNKAVKSTSPTVTKLEKDFERMEKQLARFGVTIGLSIAAAVTAVGLFTASVVSADAALDDMAEMTGATVEQLSALQNVAYVSGQNFDSVRMAMGKLSQNLSIVDDESKAAAVALSDIGLSVDEIKRLSPDQQMLKIAKALDQFEDSGSKAAIVQALYKRGAQELLPFLKDLAREGQLVSTVTTRQAAEAENLEKAYRRIILGVREFFASGIRDLVPIFTELADAMKVSLETADDAEQNFEPLVETFRALAVLGANVAFVLKGIGTEIGGLGVQIGALNDISSMGPFAAFTSKGQEAWRRLTETGDRMQADAEKARKEFDDLEKRLMSAGKPNPLDEGNKDFIGPKRPKGNLNFDANAGKDTEDEKLLKGILGKTNAELEKELNRQIALIDEWASKDESRTLQAIQATNILLDTYDKESGAFEERQAKQKEADDAQRESLALDRDVAAFNEEVDRAQSEQTERTIKALDDEDKERQKNKKTIEEFNDAYRIRINEIQGEGDALNKTALERELAIEGLKLEVEYSKAKIGLNDEELAQLAEIYKMRKAQLADAVAAKVQAKTIADAMKEQAEESEKIWDNFVEHVQNALGDELYNIIDGNFKNIGDSFLKMIKRMLADALAAKLMNALFGDKSVAGGGGGLDLIGLGAKALSFFAPAPLPADISPAFGAKGAMFAGGMADFAAPFAAGGVFGSMMAFANGGIVDKPTPFKFSNGGGMRNGVMGEAGPEAILPLKRDASGRLGVSAGNSKGSGLTINNTTIVNIDSRSDQAMVRKQVQQGVDAGNAALVEKLQRSGAI